jgi:hypothetical protein
VGWVVMADDILVVLDICLQRIRSGETLEQCLADFPEYRSELTGMLQTVQSLQTLKQVSPSAEFRRDSQARLLSQIRSESVRKNQGRERSLDLRNIGRSLVFRTLVPVTLVVLIALIVWAALPLFSPAPVSSNDFTLSILSGAAEVKAADSSEWKMGSDGMTLETGSSVRTAFDSAALLTFFDGSTAKLEAGAEVLVSRSEYTGTGSPYYIELEQQTGKTWCYVLAGGEEKPQFAVQTPHGRAVAQGTAFSTSVENSGRTLFAVMEGAVQIKEGDREIHLAAGQQIQVGDQMALSTPQPAPPVKQEFIVSTGLQGIGSVRDPSGASTGYFPDGMSFNQITGSKSVLSPDGQQIWVEEPASGEYVLVVRSLAGEAVPVDIQAKQEGRMVFQYAETLPATAGDGWIIRIRLDARNQPALIGKVVSLEPLFGKTPEKVIEPDLAKKRATPILPSGSQTPVYPAPETTEKPVATATPAPEPVKTPIVPVNTPDVAITPVPGTPEATKTTSIPAGTTPTPVATPVKVTTEPAKTTVTANVNTSVTEVTPVKTTPEPVKTPGIGTGNNSGTAATTVAATPEPVKTPSAGSGDSSDTSTGSGTTSGTSTGAGNASDTSTGTGDTSGTSSGTGTNSGTSSGTGTNSGTSTGSGTTSGTSTGSGSISGASTGTGTTSGTSTGTGTTSGTGSTSSTNNVSGSVKTDASDTSSTVK